MYCQPLKQCMCYKRAPSPEALESEHVIHADCSGLGLQHIPHGLPPNTEVLYLNDNAIETISKSDFQNAFGVDSGGGQKLKRLFLHNNGDLSEIAPAAFEELGSLKELYLHYTRIYNLRSGTLQGLTSLKILWANNANIQTIDADALSGAVNIKELFLQNNQIVELHPNTFNGLAKLKVLEIHEQCSKGRKCDRDTHKISSFTCCTLCGLPKSAAVIVDMEEGSKLRCGCGSDGDDVTECPSCYDECTVWKYGNEPYQDWMGKELQEIRLQKKLSVS